MAMTRGGLFDRARELQQLENAVEVLFRRLTGMAGMPEAAVAPIREAYELSRMLVTRMREEMEREASTLRSAQVLRVLPAQILGHAIVEVALQGGEVILKRLPPEFAARVSTGTVVALTRDHEQVLDILGDGLPTTFTVGTVTAATGTNGTSRVRVASADSRNEQELFLAWCFPPEGAKVGRRVAYYGRCVYELREDAPSPFLDSKRRTNFAFGVRPEGVFGADQQDLILALRVALDVYLRPEHYPDRQSREGENRFLVSGPPGIGKSEAIRAFLTVAHEALGARLECINLAANSLRASLVGETERRIEEMIQTANQLATDGKFVVVVLEEATNLLLDRSRSAQFLDSGSTMQASETIMAALDSVAGKLDKNVVLIATSNRSDLMDRASIGRFVQKPVQTFGAEEFTAIVRHWATRKDAGVYAAPWGREYEEALEAAMKVVVGSVTIGDRTRELQVQHALTGRLARWAHVEAARVVDRAIFLAGDCDAAPLAGITPALLHTSVVREARAELAPWSVEDARNHLAGTDLCRAGQERSVTAPRALAWEDVALEERYDARPLAAELRQLAMAV